MSDTIFANNIKALRDRYDLTQGELADKLLVTQATVSSWEAKGVQPRQSMIDIICEKYGVTNDDLKSETNGLYAKQAQQFIRPVPAYTTAPVYGTIKAGEPFEEVATYENDHYVDPDVKEQYPDAFFLTIRGDSMNKVLPDGCYALVDPGAQPQSGDILAVNVNGYDATVKRVYFAGDVVVLQPESDNPENRALSLDSSDPDADRVRIIGKVVWHTIPSGFKY